MIFLQPNAKDLEFNDDSLFPRHIGIKEATLLLVKEKLGRYSLLRVSYSRNFESRINFAHLLSCEILCILGAVVSR